MPSPLPHLFSWPFVYCLAARRYWALLLCLIAKGCRYMYCTTCTCRGWLLYDSSTPRLVPQFHCLHRPFNSHASSSPSVRLQLVLCAAGLAHQLGCDSTAFLQVFASEVHMQHLAGGSFIYSQLVNAHRFLVLGSAP